MHMFLNRTLALGLAACAMLANVACANETALRSAIGAKFPKANVQSVTKIPGADLYELVIDGEIYYADPALKYLMDGNLIDMSTMNSVTSARKRELEDQEMKRLAMKFDDLPLQYAFKKVVGDGSRRMAYFADPNCGYCKKFDRETLPKVDNVTIYMFMYPVITEQSKPLTKAVWCSPDRSAAWDDYVIRGVTPKAAPTCDNPIDKILAFGQDKRLRGTPTLFFADGTRVPGAIGLEQLQELLARAGK
jgi:thiol:disulfide interchange protein DsbC